MPGGRAIARPVLGRGWGQGHVHARRATPLEISAASLGSRLTSQSSDGGARSARRCCTHGTRAAEEHAFACEPPHRQASRSRGYGMGPRHACAPPQHGPRLRQQQPTGYLPCEDQESKVGIDAIEIRLINYVWIVAKLAPRWVSGWLGAGGGSVGGCAADWECGVGGAVGAVWVAGHAACCQVGLQRLQAGQQPSRCI